MERLARVGMVGQEICLNPCFNGIQMEQGDSDWKESGIHKS